MTEIYISFIYLNLIHVLKGTDSRFGIRLCIVFGILIFFKSKDLCGKL